MGKKLSSKRVAIENMQKEEEMIESIYNIDSLIQVCFSVNKFMIQTHVYPNEFAEIAITYFVWIDSR